VLCALVSSAAIGCKPKIPEPEPQQPTVSTPAQPPTQPTPKPSAAAEAPKAKAGWREVTAQNNLPLCVFGSASERESVKAVAQVKKQLLRPDRPVVFGVFAPHCINPECTELTTLQCSVERSGNTLRLQTRFVGLHKDGSSCRDGCREATAGCESPVLEPGEYTLEYGGTETPLKIPSSLNMPCFKRS
jgi:hypothetical protein